MVLIWLIKGVFYKIFYYIQKISECNSVELTYYQKKQRRYTKYSKRLLWKWQRKIKRPSER